MDWQKGKIEHNGKMIESRYFIQSKCGYRVSKSGGTYTAWTNLAPGHREIIKSGLKTEDAGKAECELYAMAKPIKA